LALGIGMLVDAGIVVIENIFQYRQKGKTPREAAVLGTEEVASAIIGSVLTTVAVFLPLVFVVGIAGQLFRELALTVTYSLLASLVIALTLMPALASWIRAKTIRSEPDQETQQDAEDALVHRGLLARIMTSLLDRLLRIYEVFLRHFLTRRRFYIVLTLVLFCASIVLFTKMDREFLPKVDQGQFIVKMDLKAGTRLDVTNRIAQEIESLLFALPELENVTASAGSTSESSGGEQIETLGSHQAQFVVNLKEKRTRSTTEIVTYLKNVISRMDLEEARIEYILQGSVFASAIEQGEPIVVKVKGHDLLVLERLSQQMQRSLASIPGVFGVKTSQGEPSPETKVHVIKDRAALHNLSVTQIAQTAQIAVKGVVATKFKEGGREIDVRVRLRPEDRKNAEKLRRIPVQTPSKQIIPISDVAYFTKGLGPSEIKRIEQSRVIFVSANFSGRNFSAVTRDVQMAIDRMNVPTGYSVLLTGEQERMKESFNSLRFALILALLLVYMIMAAEFESLWQPFIIFFTVPMGIIGVVLWLFVLRVSLNVLVLLGLILLGGIVVNNGIVLVEYINLMRKGGLELEEALVEAGKRRLRPILMTSMTTIVGLLPLAIGMGKGSELRSPMALTVIAGLTTSTFLTLGVLPALFMSGEHFLLRMRELLKCIPAIRYFQKEAVPALAVAAAPVEKEVLPPPETAVQVLRMPVLPEKPEPQLPRFSRRQEEALAYLRQVGRLTRKEYAQHFHVSIPTASRDLKELVDQGYLRGVGPLGPGRWYELTGKE
ncbi:MAG: efflux RND transporter permease subunit, partial [Candidatus Omnitrophota bacterium]